MRDRLIDAAIDLFYRRGFQSVGLDHLLATVGVTKTTFYKYFDSKDDLMVAAVEKRDQWETQAWQRAVRMVGGDDPRAQLLAYFDVLNMWFNDAAFGGCMFINTAAEFPNPNDPIHQAAAAHKRATRDQFCHLRARPVQPMRSDSLTFTPCWWKACSCCGRCMIATTPPDWRGRWRSAW